MKQMTPLEILNETVAFYGGDLNRRAVTRSPHYRCRYLTEDGKMCAVGRCLKNPDPNLDANVAVAWDVMVFKPEYDLVSMGYPEKEVILFWEEVQGLHDSLEVWGTEGQLSVEGMRRVEIIKRMIREMEGEGQT